MRQHKLFWGSSYDRGLNVLLTRWPTIKEKFPDAELHVAYGWDLFDKITINNAERQGWKAMMVNLMKQEGITDHGRVSKEDLKKLRQECGILAYCSDFTEIFCITAMECQANGCVPVTVSKAALGGFTTGRVVIKGEDIYDNETQKEYFKELLALMGDEERWKKLQAEGLNYATQFTWEIAARQWETEFEEASQSIKVSIITPTIRRGFWNIMANNIAKQTYKNIEWIVVDDFPTARDGIAKEYADKYMLDLKYVRGKPRKTQRHYGLVNANNTGLQKASGELLIILQDFILMPEDGVEQLVNLYRKNPDALLAPCDKYFAPLFKPNTESEDWFDGETEVTGKFMRQNIRINGEGLRFSDHPFDFEQNYGAVPKKIAEALGGWYEFYDEGLGFDNTEFAYRALKSGYKIIVDETNVCTCIDHWETLKGTVEHGLERERRLNDPRFIWEKQMIEDGKLPLVRTQELDDKIELLYTIPEDLGQQDAVEWMREHLPEIVQKFYREMKI